ncbi:MAG: zinc-ribbon domain-containing protein [Anaerovoracaceae bacterium]
MQDFLNKSVEVAKKTANMAANKAGEMVEIGKLKANISSEKSDIAGLQKRIGKYCYDKYLAGQEFDLAVSEFCSAISEHEATIDGYEEKIKEAKERDD